MSSGKYLNNTTFFDKNKMPAYGINNCFQLFSILWSNLQDLSAFSSYFLEKDKTLGWARSSYN